MALQDFEQQELMDTAYKTINTIWHWDYRDWSQVDALVTGPMATLLKNSMEDSDDPCSKDLISLTTAFHSLESNEYAKICADYVWQDRDSNNTTNERIIWHFTRIDNCWKALTISRQ